VTNIALYNCRSGLVPSKDSNLSEQWPQTLHGSYPGMEIYAINVESPSSELKAFSKRFYY
jgi:hypothetical protein